MVHKHHSVLTICFGCRNHWATDALGLGELQSPLWNYMAKTWAPRGAETAKLVYGADDGWVVHDEVNVFGHTG